MGQKVRNLNLPGVGRSCLVVEPFARCVLTFSQLPVLAGSGYNTIEFLLILSERP